MEKNTEINNSKNWILGVFYYNKEDKRIFPPKKNGAFGFTVNFANPRSVLCFILFLILILVPVFLILLKR